MHAVPCVIITSALAIFGLLTGQSAGCGNDSGDIELPGLWAMSCCGTSWTPAVSTAAFQSPR